MKPLFLLKLSGELLQSDDSPFDRPSVDALVSSIVGLSRRYRLAIVVGAGNLWRYKTMKDFDLPRSTSDTLGMLGTVYNASILAHHLSTHDITAHVMTPQHLTIPGLSQPFDARAGKQYLADGDVVFCAGGTGNPYCTTDLAAVLRALELGCEGVIKVTTVDGVYNRDPRVHDDATRYDHITHTQVLHQSLAVMDQSAFGMASENDLSLSICSFAMMQHFGTDTRQGTVVSKRKE